MTHWTIRVYGRVQGVGFRYFTFRKAQKLNLKGWVRNEPDGSVLIALQASQEQRDAFLTDIKKGPCFSKVTDVQYEECAEEIHTEFLIKR